LCKVFSTCCKCCKCCMAGIHAICFRYFVLLRPRVREIWWSRLIALLRWVSPSWNAWNALPHAMKILPTRASFVAAVRRMVRGVDAWYWVIYLFLLTCFVSVVATSLLDVKTVGYRGFLIWSSEHWSVVFFSLMHLRMVSYYVLSLVGLLRVVDFSNGH
jgi:hypothetical protein